MPWGFSEEDLFVFLIHKRCDPQGRVTFYLGKEKLFGKKMVEVHQ